jgi:GntR family transcriptional regulator of arabinose operon
MENENIIWRRRGSGTFVQAPGRDLSKGSFMVGVISTYFSDYIFPGIVTGIERTLAKNNVTMQLTTTHNLVAEESRALTTMLAQNIKGLLVEPSKSALPNPNTALYEEIKARNIPLVFFNAKYPDAPFPCVAMDDVAAASAVTEHLILKGHEKISAILASDDIQGHKRYQGFVKSLEKNGIQMAEQRVMWFSTQEQPFFFDNSQNRILALLEDSTAVVCYNDLLAVNMLEFCKRQGIAVPGDVSIVGIDDAMRARICEVPLTTARHPQQQLGERAAELLLRMIDDPSAGKDDVLFVPKLIVRESTRNVGAKIGTNADRNTETIQHE